MNKPFVANPGLGWVHYNTMTPQGVQIWQGTMTLADGRRVSLQGTAIQGPGPLADGTHPSSKAAKIHKLLTKQHEDAGGDRWEFKIVEIGADGHPWTHLGQFTMPPFAGRKAGHLVDTCIGRLRVWPQSERQVGNRKVNNCIRFRLVTSKDGSGLVPKPM